MSGEVRSAPLHNSTFLRSCDFCAAASPTNSSISANPVAQQMRRLALCSICGSVAHCCEQATGHGHGKLTSGYLEELPAPRSDRGSTASANPKIDVEIPVGIVFGLPRACGNGTRRCSHCCFALLDRRPTPIFFDLAALLGHPALVLFNEGGKFDSTII